MWWELWLVMASVVAALALAWVRWRVRHRRLLELAERVPGPPALPLLGNALLFMAKPSEQLNLIRKIINKYGEYVRFWLGPELNIVVSNPEDIRVPVARRLYKPIPTGFPFFRRWSTFLEEIARIIVTGLPKNDFDATPLLLLCSNKVNQKGSVYDHMKPIIGPGILSGGSVWRNHRKIVTPSYNKRSVAAFARVFNMEAASLAGTLCARDPNTTFDVYWDVVNATTQCACQTLMGLSKTETQNLPNLDHLVKNTHNIYNFYFAKMTKWWLQIPFVFWLIGAKKKQEAFKKKYYPIFNEILDKRRKALALKEEVDEEVRAGVDRLLLSGELTEQELIEETFTLFTTSQEPGAKIAAGLLVLLAHLPEWQEKVYNEIQDRLGTEDTFIDEEQIKSLQYLDMCYKEVIRMLSIGPLIQRKVQEDITISSGITLPVGCSLVIPIHILHRNPKYWPDPDKADPARFLPENVKKRDPNVFVPYSLGPMDCLGRVYAGQMIKTLVVRVLQQVRLEADGHFEDLEVDVAISASLTHGYHLRAIPRRKNNRTHNVA